MKHRTSWFCGIVIVLLLFFIFFMPSLGMRLRWLLVSQVSVPNDSRQLAAENESLAAKLSELTVVANELPGAPGTALRAMVYSNYPFNFKSEMTVDAGSADGVATGDAVLFNKNLIGLISAISAHRSIVRTIFDPNFKLQVRIGIKGYDALLVGGPYPMAESIMKVATIAAGDVVYSAASNVPYAVPVGTVASVGLAPDNLFEQASLLFPYDMGGIQAVEILTNSQA
jgi:cell shape-determining protein MreC